MDALSWLRSGMGSSFIGEQAGLGSNNLGFTLVAKIMKTFVLYYNTTILYIIGKII